MATREEWMRRLGPLYGGAVALVHSTPLAWPAGLASDETRSPFWTVALGLPIGAVAWLVALLLRWFGLPVPLAAIAGMATLTLASAAIVERGLVERIDRVPAGAGPAAPSTLAILVLVFTTLLRVGAFVWLSPTRWLGVLVGTALVGRWAAMFLQALGDPILDDDAPRSLVASPAPAWLTAALSLGVAAILALGIGKAGIVALALAAVTAFALGLDAQRRDRGLTSSVVATAAAVAELLVLLAATV